MVIYRIQARQHHFQQVSRDMKHTCKHSLGSYTAYASRYADAKFHVSVHAVETYFPVLESVQVVTAEFSPTVSWSPRVHQTHSILDGLKIRY